jgi:hypothetical protein
MSSATHKGRVNCIGKGKGEYRKPRDDLMEVIMSEIGWLV